MIYQDHLPDPTCGLSGWARLWSSDLVQSLHGLQINATVHTEAGVPKILQIVVWK